MASPRTALGPLTTLFTPLQGLAGCEGRYEKPGEQGIFLWQGQTCKNGQLVDDIRCYPSVTATPTATSFSGLGFYSPGLVCPKGMVTACAAAQPSDAHPANQLVSITGIPFFEFQFSMLPNETAYGCCSSLQTCTSVSGAQTCMLEQGVGTWEVQSCAPTGMVSNIPWIGDQFVLSPLIQLNQFGIDPDAGNQITTSGAAATSTNTPSRPTNSILDPSQSINIVSVQSSSGSGSKTTAASTISSILGSTTNSPIQSQGAQPQAAPGDGLTVAAKAGIGVSIGVAVLALVALSYVIWWYIQQKNLRVSLESGQSPGVALDMLETHYYAKH